LAFQNYRPGQKPSQANLAGLAWPGLFWLGLAWLMASGQSRNITNRPVPERRLSSPTLPRSTPLIERLLSVDLLQVSLLDRVAGMHTHTLRDQMSLESKSLVPFKRKRSLTGSSVISSNVHPSKRTERTGIVPDLNSNDWDSQICHGMGQQGEVNLSIVLSAAPAPANFLNYMEKTSPGANSLYEQPPTPPKEFRPPNGSRFFREKSLNLDHFLSSIVRTQIDEDRKARIGETHLTFSTSEAKRKVRNTADWAAAWRWASEAVVFAFPHRREELEQYQKHIQVKFDARRTYTHQRIIAYDIAVRNFVGGGQTSLLTDCEKFSHLYSAIVLPDGIEFTSSFPSSSTRRTAPARTSKGATETCNKFNTYSGCSHSPCKYKHICKKCGGDHPQNECDNSQRK